MCKRITAPGHVLISKPETLTTNFHLGVSDDINGEFLIIAFLMSDNTHASNPDLFSPEPEDQENSVS